MAEVMGPNGAPPRVLPRRRDALLFAIKAWGLRGLRGLRDLRQGAPRRLPKGARLQSLPVLAVFESSLWPADEQELRLVAGKIHNLRLAAAHLHGLEVPTGQTFSFWRQLGRARAGRGFVVGRELREGCLVPAIGGGLCQLSNAIYDCALRAGMEVVERHRHSRVVPGSLAERDRDATVFWNYLDLRLRASFDWRLEIELDADHLHVRLRGEGRGAAAVLPLKVEAARPPPSARIGDCSSCDQSDCHRHEGPGVRSLHRTWLVEESWPEFEAYRRQQWQPDDRLLGLGSGRAAQPKSFLARLPSRLRWWLARWRGRPVPQARAHALASVAQALGNRLAPEDLQLVVPQGLLPYLWQSGALAGRRFEVLMNALPMQQLQAQLDRAAARHPGSPTLGDFRAPAWMVAAEAAALARAERWVSPHAGILALAGNRAHRLAWCLPEAPALSGPDRRNPPSLLFPASGLARKGVLELREALAGSGLRVLVPPGAVDDAETWTGLEVVRVASVEAGLQLATCVVLPAWVEHQPRGLLAAIARGVPVIATPACGLPEDLPWIRVAEGDAHALRTAIGARLGRPEPLPA
jgi:hypothetical protein